MNIYDTGAALKQPRGRPAGRTNTVPRDIDRVIFILRRHRRGESFARIAQELNITRSGARLLALRWKDDSYVNGILSERYPTEN